MEKLRHVAHITRKVYLPQHTPAMNVSEMHLSKKGKTKLFIISDRTVHEHSTHAAELVTLEGFSEYIGPHFIRRAILEINISVGITILDQKVFGTDVLASVRS